ncbi:hypothetical protein COO59_16395 [Mixta theicola]|uniref:Calcineurin-like phosphoesterase domain-containing protein n=2 Tax=Mixta theicola TaxID=1458355 RepID=A0A2K1Q6P3_9GAMM|nr:hypothetical protein COO59_16395 [Mixta theicola]
MLKGVNPQQTLAEVLTVISRQHRDYLMVTGDISEDASPASYRHFAHLLQQHQLESAFCIPGNHDDPVLLRERLAAFSAAQVCVTERWVFLLLNSHREHADDGEIPPHELDRLTQLLAQHRDKHAAIFLHHHVLPLQSRWIDRYILRNGAAFLQTIRSAQNVRAVIHGHVHQASQRTCQGTEFFATPSTCVQFVAGEADQQTAGLGPGWRTFRFYDDGRIESEVHYLNVSPHG